MDVTNNIVINASINHEQWSHGEHSEFSKYNQVTLKIQSLFNDPSKRITVLTGAGISAESGIPTFRGPEGYWTIGSRDYHPQEMATYSMYCRQPDEVWKWYLHRLSVCGKAEPNAGHLALVEFESSMAIAAVTDLLIIAGTSGATTLPNHVASIVHQNGGTIIDINIEQNPFSELAMNNPGGAFMKMTCSKGLKQLLA